MKNVLLIRIPPPVSSVDSDTIVQWGKYAPSGSLMGEFHLTAIHQLKESWLADKPGLGEKSGEEEGMLPDEIVLFLGGTLCFHKRLTINASQKKHLTTALPYLVEEHVAQNIETMHIVNGFLEKDQQVSVAAIPHSALQGILALFEEHQLSPTNVLAEMQFLVPDPECTTLLLDNDAVMISSPGREGITLNYDALPFVFSEHSDQEMPDTLEAMVSETTKGHPSQVRLMFSDNTLAVAAAKLEEASELLSERGWLVDKFSLQGGVFEFFAEQYFALKKRNQLVDFRQGAYQCPRRAGRFIRRWWPVAAVASCWLILELGLSVTEGVIYQQQAESHWSNSIKSYLSVFPSDQQARNAQARKQMSFNVKQIMENRFRSLDIQSTEKPFLPMLQALSTISGSMGEKAGLEPRSLDFNDASGQLVYEFEAGNLETVNQFLEKLNTSGFSGKLDNANQGKSGVIARVTIRR